MSTSNPSKRQREDEPVEPSKRQRQSKPRSQAQHQQLPDGNLYRFQIVTTAMNKSPYGYYQVAQVGYGAPQPGAYSLHPDPEMHTGQYGQTLLPLPPMMSHAVGHPGYAAAQPVPTQASPRALEELSKPSDVSNQTPGNSLEHLYASSAAPPTPSAPSSTDDSVQKNLYASQKQWLQVAKDDLESRLITTVPGIDKIHWLVGNKMPSDKDLVPSHVWHLRSFQPSKRYIAYQYLVSLARHMIKYDQPSKEYQDLWTALSGFRTRLVQHEREWLADMKRGTAEEIVNFLKRVGNDQAADTMVTQAMVDESDAYQKARLPALLNAHQGADTTHPRAPTAAQRPSEQNKSEKNGKTASPIHQDASVKPDKIKYSNDRVRVPEYPPDELSYYTPNSHTGMYKCRHPHETKNSCCQKGLTAAKMRSSIQKEITTWRSRVEMLIHKGQLDPRHKTWDKIYNLAIKKERETTAMALAGQAAKEEAEARVEKARQEQRKEKRLQHAAQIREDEEKRKAEEEKRTEEKQEKEINEAITASREPPASLTKQPEAKVKKLTPDAKAAALKKHKRERQNCKALESRKKWPNWDRFNAWWAVERLQAEGAVLSAEQRALLQGPEPSGIPDRNPDFIKKKETEKKAGERK
ncbi:hypothetical protein PTMSG1_08509 [Pyrenophora teres f. maculata]|nr:hypothetical protein PTMSG1_08509 [Pyrenophora teres f. maculata]